MGAVGARESVGRASASMVPDRVPTRPSASPSAFSRWSSPTTRSIMPLTESMARSITARLDAIDCSSEEHTSEFHSLLRTSYDVFCLKKNTYPTSKHKQTNDISCDTLTIEK